MYKNKTILSIVPARGGSKGLPGKNIKKLNGKPLICWTIDQARKSKYLDEIYISTDSSEIANICNEWSGFAVEDLRPNYLAQDNTSSADVVRYTLDTLEKRGKVFDYILLLEPTSPLRKDDDIDNIIELACNNSESDGVISVGEIHMEHPIAAKAIDKYGRIRPYMKISNTIHQRQQMDKAYFPYGVAYIIKTKVFYDTMSFYSSNICPFVIERWQCYEVDDIYDFICIESIMKNRNLELPG